MKLFVSFFILFGFSNLANSKSIVQKPKSSLENMILSISYPEKASYFQFKKNQSVDELILVTDGKVRKKRRLSSKDLVWLEKRVSMIKKEERVPTSKCQLGEVTLAITLNSKTESARRCIGAKDETTDRLLTLSKTLYTFL